MPIGKDACDQLSKRHVTYFSMLVFTAMSNTSSSSLHLKHDDAVTSFRIERQFFKMKNA